MTEHSIYISQLLQKHLAASLNEQEQVELDNWLNKDPANREMFNFLTDPDRVRPELQKMFEYDKAAMSTKLNEAFPLTVRRVHFLRTSWFRYAAAIILIIGAGAYLWNTGKHETFVQASETGSSHDVAPGKEGAVLTLSDGTQVTLDNLSDRVIADQNGTEIMLKNGQLTYKPKKGPADEIVFNTMTTPNGRQFNLMLPDGTLVWLNAASSIRYPTIFTGNEREVSITGEAYFEVKKNSRLPFFVKIDERTTVEVLGTHFNINAYSDEPQIKTTLLEGSVMIKKGASAKKLRPGQQACFSDKDPDMKVVDDVDVDQVMAWKYGTFSFQDANIQTVMRQLARWYDVEVKYHGKMPSGAFSGEIGRSLTLQQVLNGLSQARIDFRIENDQITILPEK